MKNYHCTTIDTEEVLNSHFLDVFYGKMVCLQRYFHLIIVHESFLQIAVNLGMMKTIYWHHWIPWKILHLFDYLNFKIRSELISLQRFSLEGFCQHWWPFCNITSTSLRCLVYTLIMIMLLCQMLQFDLSICTIFGWVYLAGSTNYTEKVLNNRFLGKNGLSTKIYSSDFHAPMLFYWQQLN